MSSISQRSAPSNRSEASTPSSLNSHYGGWHSRFDSKFDSGYGLFEPPSAYRPGGYHPVSLGDMFDNGRYRVERKLGHGGSATVWLASDEKLHRMVALKILSAKLHGRERESSAYEALRMGEDLLEDDLEAGRRRILCASRSFTHIGPNGRHTCLILELMGPDVGHMVNFYSQDRSYVEGAYPLWIAKSLCKQLLLALNFLHYEQFCHGDLDPENLLFTLRPLTNADTASLLAAPSDEGTAVGPLVRADGKQDRWAPEFVHEDSKLYEFAKVEPGFLVKLSGLGSMLQFDDLQACNGTSSVLRAPEQVLQIDFDHCIEIWSFECLMYQFIVGIQLFESYYADEEGDDDHLLQMQSLVGPLPIRFRAFWQNHDVFFDEKLKRTDMCVGGYEKSEGSETEQPDSIEEVFMRRRPEEVDEVEAAEITRVLRKILQLDPDNRPTTAELLEDPWFQGIEVD